LEKLIGGNANIYKGGLYLIVFEIKKSMKASTEEPQQQEPPKKPLTAFFFFRAAEGEKGNKLGAKDAGKLWAELSEEKKKPFVEKSKQAKEVYDKYMEEVVGVQPKKGGKPNCFNALKVRAICTSEKGMKPAENMQVYKGLAKVMVLLDLLKFVCRKSSSRISARRSITRGRTRAAKSRPSI